MIKLSDSSELPSPKTPSLDKTFSIKSLIKKSFYLGSFVFIVGIVPFLREDYCKRQCIILIQPLESCNLDLVHEIEIPRKDQNKSNSCCFAGLTVSDTMTLNEQARKIGSNLLGNLAQRASIFRRLERQITNPTLQIRSSLKVRSSTVHASVHPLLEAIETTSLQAPDVNYTYTLSTLNRTPLSTTEDSVVMAPSQGVHDYSLLNFCFDYDKGTFYVSDGAQNMVFQSREKLQRTGKLDPNLALPTGREKEFLSYEDEDKSSSYEEFRSYADFLLTDKQKRKGKLTDTQAERYEEEKLIYGTAHLIAKEHNLQLVEYLQNSPNGNRASELVQKAIAENLTESNKKVNLNIKSKERLLLQVRDPQILSLVLEVEKKLTLADQVSIPQFSVKPSVKFIGGESQESIKELNPYCETLVYSKRTRFKEAVEKNLEKLNKEIEKGEHVYRKALSPEDVICTICKKEKFLERDRKDVKKRQYLAEHFSFIYDEMQKQRSGFGESTSTQAILFDEVFQTVEPFTFALGEADHVHRAALRRGFDQRSVGTRSKDDTGLAIYIPKEAHKEKERISFAESENTNYKTGLSTFLNLIQERTEIAFKTMSSSVRKNILPSDYVNSYNYVSNLKFKEMKDKYPEVSDTNLFKIYHANLISGSNETRLELWNNNFRNNSTLESSSINKKGLKTPEGQIYVKAIVKMRDLAKVECEHSLGLLDLLTETSSSPQAKEQLGMIKEQSWYQSKALIISIDNKISNLTDLPLDNELTIENLTSTLFDSVEKSKDTLTEDEQNVIVYNFMKEEKITDVGKGFPINSLFYNLQNIEREFNSPNAEVRKQAIDRLNEVNDNIDKALDRSPLISLPDMVLASEEAFQFHSYLKAQGVPTSLADLIVKKANINNLEDLLAKVEDNYSLKKS